MGENTGGRNAGDSNGIMDCDKSLFPDMRPFMNLANDYRGKMEINQFSLSFPSSASSSEPRIGIYSR